MDFGVIIREAVQEDAASLVEFNRSMALETEDRVLELSALKSGVSSVFEDDRKGFYVVAETQERKIVGGLLIVYEWSDWKNAWYWWITSVYITPDFRKKGIFRRMYGYVKKKALSRQDVSGFRLYVDLENQIAQRVYENVGMFASKYLMFGENLKEP